MVVSLTMGRAVATRAEAQTLLWTLQSCQGSTAAQSSGFILTPCSEMNPELLHLLQTLGFGAMVLSGQCREQGAGLGSPSQGSVTPGKVW